MSHSHNNKLSKKFMIGLILNTGFTIFEFVVGFSVGSLALISDASHNLTDSLSLLIAFFGDKVSAIESDADHTYGHGRASILSAMLNGLILVGLAFFIFYEAYLRLLSPAPVLGQAIVLVALAGIVVNGSIALLFRNDRANLNVRAAFVNMAFDTLASVGALLAGLLIIITENSIFDSVISVVIGIMLIISAWGVVKDAIHVLLEGVPKGLDINEVKDTILRSKQVKKVDDMHVWAISSEYAALSCHIVIEDCALEEATKLVAEIKADLKQKHYIAHATIETELIECDPKNN